MLDAVNTLSLAVYVLLTSLLTQFSGELKLKQKGNHLFVKEISIGRPQTAASLGGYWWAANKISLVSY